MEAHRLRLGLVVALCLLGLAFASGWGAAPASAATPTVTHTPIPTRTPTPVINTTYLLSSGNGLIIERRYTFGDLAISVSLIALCAITAIGFIYQMVRR